MLKGGVEGARISGVSLKEVKATGQLTLVYSYEESYSGHQIIINHVRLVPGNTGMIVLDESDEDIGCIPGMLSYCTNNKYEIDSDSLIALIKEHGKKVE